MKIRFAIMALLLIGCTKAVTTMESGSSGDASVLGLCINEIVAQNSLTIDDIGEHSDWFELYNSGFEHAELKEGEWFVSDAGLEDPERFELPEVTIPARGAIVIWCDKLNDPGPDIHANFALSSSGEHLVLYHKAKGSGRVVDQVKYSEHGNPGPLAARYPDGSDIWVVPIRTSPGEPNLSTSLQ